MPSTPLYYSDAGWLQWPDNEAYSFQFMRMVGAAQEGASTASECFFAAMITPGGNRAAHRIAIPFKTRDAVRDEFAPRLRPPEPCRFSKSASDFWTRLAAIEIRRERPGAFRQRSGVSAGSLAGAVSSSRRNGGFLMLYRGMDRAQPDIAHNNHSRRAAQEGASTVSECFFAARLIKPGDDESWCEAWKSVADINNARGDEAFARGGLNAATGNWLRASNYYRAAELFLDAKDPRREFLFRGMRRRRRSRLYLEHIRPRGEVVRIPYQGGSFLEGYFHRRSEGSPVAAGRGLCRWGRPLQGRATLHDAKERVFMRYGTVPCAGPQTELIQ
jgi:hypothetical protein